MKQKITSMPWLKSKEGQIDLELENVKTGEDLIFYIEGIFQGNPVKDKYGNIMKLNTRDEKITFIRELELDSIFNAFVRKLLSENEQRLLAMFLDNIEEETLSEEEINEIQKGLEDVKRGKVKPIEQVARELGITLR